MPALSARPIVTDSPRVFLVHSSQYEAMRPSVKRYEDFPNTSYLGSRTTWLE